MSAMYEKSVQKQKAIGRAAAWACLALVAVFFLGACANKTACIDKALSAARTLNDAHYRFGAPKNSIPQPDGTTVYEWVLDVNYAQAGHYEMETSPWVRHDADGYRIETEREVWKGPRRTTKFCLLSIHVDAEGRVLSSEYKGTDCCDLVMRPATSAEAAGGSRAVAQ